MIARCFGRLDCLQGDEASCVQGVVMRALLQFSDENLGSTSLQFSALSLLFVRDRAINANRKKGRNCRLKNRKFVILSANKGH